LLAVFFLPLFGMSLCHFSQQLRKNEAKQKEKKKQHKNSLKSGSPSTTERRSLSAGWRNAPMICAAIAIATHIEIHKVHD